MGDVYEMSKPSKTLASILALSRFEDAAFSFPLGARARTSAFRDTHRQSVETRMRDKDRPLPTIREQLDKYRKFCDKTGRQITEQQKKLWAEWEADPEILNHRGLLPDVDKLRSVDKALEGKTFESEEEAQAALSAAADAAEAVPEVKPLQVSPISSADSSDPPVVISSIRPAEPASSQESAASVQQVQPSFSPAPPSFSPEPPSLSPEPPSFSPEPPPGPPPAAPVAASSSPPGVEQLTAAERWPPRPPAQVPQGKNSPETLSPHLEAFITQELERRGQTVAQSASATDAPSSASPPVSAMSVPPPPPPPPAAVTQVSSPPAPPAVSTAIPQQAAGAKDEAWKQAASSMSQKGKRDPNKSRVDLLQEYVAREAAKKANYGFNPNAVSAEAPSQPAGAASSPYAAFMAANSESPPAPGAVAAPVPAAPVAPPMPAASQQVAPAAPSIAPQSAPVSQPLAAPAGGEEDPTVFSAKDSLLDWLETHGGAIILSGEQSNVAAAADAVSWSQRFHPTCGRMVPFLRKHGVMAQGQPDVIVGFHGLE